MSFEELSTELERPLTFERKDVEKTEPKKEHFSKVIELTNKLKKSYGDLIKSVLIFGSAATGKARKTSDTDVWVILDDTATKSSEDLKRVSTQIQLLSTQLKDIHIQTTGLTEFWGWMKRGSPELFNFLRVGLVIYDTGFVKPVQRMLKLGLLPPSEETVKIKSKSADALVKRIEAETKLMVFDLRYAATDACQAVIMHYYKETPDQKAMPDHLKKLVDEKKLEEEYVDKFKELNKLWKDLDHKIIEKAEPKHLEKAMVLSTDIIKRMKKILPKDLT